MLLRESGERGLIRRLRRMLPSLPEGCVGAGDDCAVLRVPGAPLDWLLTSDPVIEGTHFLADTPPADIGHKAIGRILSDIAAMGGTPDWALIDLVAAPSTPIERIEAIYEGALALASRAGLAIVGGDSARGPTLELHVFGVGHVPGGTALLRSGARPSDALYVTGELGGSLLGRHLRFEPRLAQGDWLRRNRWPSAMMDLSDGLARDLANLAEAGGVGMLIEADRVPVSEAARRMGGNLTPAEHALFDGEDFELLLAVPAEKELGFTDAWRQAFDLPCTRIGVVTAQAGAVECRHADGRVTPLHNREFEHFQ
jgi:thiamine-monophosphate kinase